MLHKQASNEVHHMLRKLTTASRLERYRDRVDLRHQAEETYRHMYTWLEEHHVRFVYDHTQSCYVEIEDD